MREIYGNLVKYGVLENLWFYVQYSLSMQFLLKALKNELALEKV